MGDPSDSRFRVLFEAALQAYETQTGTKLIDHPLARQLNDCHSVESIIGVLEQQARPLTEFRKDGKVMKSLKRAVNVLYAISKCTTIREHVGLLFPPAGAILQAFAILFTAIKDVSACYDALLELFQSIELFLSRLDVYTELPLNPAMETIVIKIMVEILSSVALATKQIKQSRPLKLVKKMFGENEIDAALQRINRLTVDEARMTAAQTLELIYGLVQNMRVVMEDGKASADNIRETLEIIQDMANKMNKSEREKIQEDIRRWLSPPDPWKNHNTARESHYGDTSRWLLQGNTFAKWKSSDQHLLLWIHGKPGAGKSVISSTIIEDIHNMRKRGLANLGFFYCDFRDDDKKKLRGLLSSLLIQLGRHSDPYSIILSDFYLDNDRGSREPGDDALIECLTRILKQPGQAPIYIIIDGLDECSNASGFPSPREKVLTFLYELIELDLPNVHICITSRPEADITSSLDPLPFHTISLHEESGQKQDIIDYISSVVHTDPRMRRWRPEDKELVIKVLTDKADGMFRWVFCQLEFLRRCLPVRIRRALEELPESLYGTYERTLQDIDNANWDIAHRIFQCVAVASRPLRVDELAEFLAFDFDEGSTPEFQPGWRPLDPAGTLLSTCSTLLAVVKVWGSEIIQFSHFSVKEFLISRRIAEAKDTISRYRISMTPSHTLVAQACLGVLLHLDDSTTSDSLKNFPLVEYAARYWVDHARFEGVLKNTMDGIKRLFDPRTRHLATWVWIYDPLFFLSFSKRTKRPSQPRASCLHYAAFTGLHDLGLFLVIERRQDVNAQGPQNSTPLHLALKDGHVQFAQMLLDHRADVNAQDDSKSTPLHLALMGGHVQFARMLLERRADVDAQDNDQSTPLHLALKGENVQFVQMLIEHGADVNAQDKHKSTPLHLALMGGHGEFAQMLLEHSADVNAQDGDKSTPLHLASKIGHVEFARMLLKYHADVNAQDYHESTPLHLASKGEHEEFAQLLLEHHADVNAQDDNKSTPLHLALKGGHIEFAQMLLEHHADVNAQDKHMSSPLHLALMGGHVKFAQMLLEHHADVNAQDYYESTPLHLALNVGCVEFAQVLLEHHADVDAQDYDKSTPLHLALRGGYVEFAQTLLEHHADVNTQDCDESTPLHLALKGGYAEFAQMLLEHSADVNVRDYDRSTALHLALKGGHVEFAQMLLERHADVNAQDDDRLTPLHHALKGGHVKFAEMLLEHCADVNAQDACRSTPLHLTSKAGHVEFARMLLERHADVNSKDDYDSTPLHLALEGGHVEFVRMLLEHHADVNDRMRFRLTPLGFAKSRNFEGMTQLLLEYGAVDP